MKTKIHPKYQHDCKVTCACGNTFLTGSTLPEIKVDICSACHPFFTGEMKFVDVQGRVEKFQAKLAAAAKIQSQSKKSKKEQKEAESKQPLTLREMIQAQRKQKSDAGEIETKAEVKKETKPAK